MGIMHINNAKTTYNASENQLFSTSRGKSLSPGFDFYRTYPETRQTGRGV